MNPRTSGQLLDQIAHLDEPALHDNIEDYGQNRNGLAVLHLVAQHAHVYPQTLDFLTTSPNAYVRSWVAANAKQMHEDSIVSIGSVLCESMVRQYVSSQFKSWV